MPNMLAATISTILLTTAQATPLEDLLVKVLAMERVLHEEKEEKEEKEKPLKNKGTDHAGHGEFKECEGLCTTDADCDQKEALICYIRTSTEKVPGCAAGGKDDVSGQSYCTDPTKLISELSELSGLTSTQFSGLTSAELSVLLSGFSGLTSAQLSVLLSGFSGLTSAQLSGLLAGLSGLTFAQLSAIWADLSGGGFTSAQLSVLLAGLSEVTFADLSALASELASGLTSGNTWSTLTGSTSSSGSGLTSSSGLTTGSTYTLEGTSTTTCARSEELEQPCDGNTDGCEASDCKAYCDDNAACNYYGTNINQGCYLYGSCDFSRTPLYSGSTYKKTTSSGTTTEAPDSSSSSSGSSWIDSASSWVKSKWG